MNIKSFGLLLFSLYLIIGTYSCTPLHQQGRVTDKDTDTAKQVPSKITVTVKTNQLKSTKEAQGTYIVTDPRKIIHITDTLIRSGENAASEGNFTIGHELITLSLELLNGSNISPKEQPLLNKLKIYERVGNFYVNLTPPSYLDSVPDEISSMVSRIQLEEMMNHFDTSQIDTNIINTNCGDWSHYNIPIVNNARVQSAVAAMVASRRKRYMERLLNKAIKYRPFMNEIFQREELPTDLTFLPLLESAFNMKALSHANASGLWQFIESTGKIFNLRNNYWVDERRDPIKSTEAAVQYFKRLYGYFGDWHLALASYNCGEGRVRRTMKKLEQSNYWGLELPQETMNYVPLYIAYQIVAKNPNCFGLTVDSTVTPYSFDTVQVSDCIDMRKIAKGIHIPIDTLTAMNPHIIKWCTPPNMNNITLYLPKGKAKEYHTYYKTLSDKDKVNWYRYRVQIGDNLGYLSEKFQTTMAAIKSINSMRGTTLIAGRHIFVPIPADANIDSLLNETKEKSKDHILNNTRERIIYKVSSGESIYGIALQFNLTVKEICEWNKKEDPRSLSIGEKLVLYIDPKNKGKAVKKADNKITPDKKKFYTVQNGETLYAISNHLKVSLDDLLEWNSKDPQHPLIHPGEQLAYYGGKTIPPTGSSTPKSTKAKNKTIKRHVIKYKVQKGNTYYSIARMFNISVDDIYNLNQLSEKDIIRPGDIILVYKPVEVASIQMSKKIRRKQYKVISGDTLWSISRLFNVSVAEICKYNEITKETPIKPGMVLSIPIK